MSMLLDVVVRQHDDLHLLSVLERHGAMVAVLVKCTDPVATAEYASCAAVQLPMLLPRSRATAGASTHREAPD